MKSLFGEPLSGSERKFPSEGGPQDLHPLREGEVEDVASSIQTDCTAHTHTSSSAKQLLQTRSIRRRFDENLIDLNQFITGLLSCRC